MELLKMGLLLLVGFLFGGYHFDDQALISERLSGHHRVKLKNTRVLKVFLFLRDKNQRSYFSTVAVCLQIYAYLLGIANFLLAAVIRTREVVDSVLYIDYGFGLLGMFAIVFFGAFYSMKRKKWARMGACHLSTDERYRSGMYEFLLRRYAGTCPHCDGTHGTALRWQSNLISAAVS